MSCYHTSTAIGFRLSNFVRHLDEKHQNQTQADKASPLNEIQINNLMTQLSVQKLKNRELRFELNSKHRTLITKQMGNASACLSAVTTAKENLSNHSDEWTKEREKILKENSALKEENMRLLTKSNADVEPQLAVEEWRQKAEELEIDLKKAKAELMNANYDRRELLHKFLEMKGKIRIVCRLRPALEESKETIQFQTKGRNLMGNSSGSNVIE